ncbi:MAG TPA: transporter [Rhizomicrobium sp.]|nr:transporter [Rhizomicrobium sp.]
MRGDHMRYLAIMFAAAVAFAPRVAAAGDISDYFDGWRDRVTEAQGSQPHWMTPLATVTPRLEQEFRYDQYWEHTGTGADINQFDSGKGLELIPTTTNEVLINLPPYEERSVKNPASGWGDWPVLTVKQRLLSANEDNGNYIVSAFLGVQAPVGSNAFTNHSWVITPTLAVGKGWGDFDVQATIGAAIPTDRYSAIGTAITTNVALQYHLEQYFWPEVEFNDTTWSGGSRDGLNQLFMTVGVILGRFEIGDGMRLIAGGGYQTALSPHLVTSPALTPIYDHNWLLSVRLAF